MGMYMRSKTELCEKVRNESGISDKRKDFDGIEYGRWAEVRFCAHFYRATVK